MKGKKWGQDEPFVVKIPILSAKSGKDRLEGKAKNSLRTMIKLDDIYAQFVQGLVQQHF